MYNEFTVELTDTTCLLNSIQQYTGILTVPSEAVVFV